MPGKREQEVGGGRREGREREEGGEGRIGGRRDGGLVSVRWKRKSEVPQANVGLINATSVCPQSICTSQVSGIATMCYIV